MRKAVIWVLGVLFFSFAGPEMVPQATAYQEGKKSKDKRSNKPGLRYDKYRRTREVDVQMAEKRKAIRGQIEELLKYEKKEKERPALLFRLAENYFEEATSYFYKAQELDEKLAKDPQNTALRKEVAKQQKALHKQEIVWRQKSIDQYKEIVDKYPNYPDRDEVLFYLAYSMWDIGQRKESLPIYRQLIQHYPKSKYVPDSYLAFGEFYFEAAKLEKALMAYKKVAEYKESPIYLYAIYKQGWVYYNKHEWDNAKDMFKSVVYLSDIEEEKIEIRKEALRDFTLTYSNSGSAKAAPNVFKRLAPKEAHEMLVSLAGMYFGDGEDKKAILVYRYLIEKEKCSTEVPFYQGRVVDCSSRVGNKRYTVQQVRELISLFNKVKKCVKKPTRRDKEKVQEARELSEITLRRLCSVWRKEARETKQKETFEYMHEICGDYLQLFPKSKDAYDIRFALAEVLFYHLGRFDRAASEYSKVVAMDLAFLKKHKKFPKKTQKNKKSKKDGSPAGTYLCDASYKSVMAHRELMKKDRNKETKAKKKKKGKAEKFSMKKLPIPKKKKKFLQAAKIYMDYCPTDKDICGLKYDIGNTYYDYQHYDQAIGRLDEVAEKCSQEPEAEYAANLVLYVFEQSKDFEKLDKYSRRYYKNRELMKNPKLRDFLVQLIPKVAFKLIESLEDKLKENNKKRKRRLSTSRIHHKVGIAYIKFVKEFPKHELADEGLFNAAVKFEQAERLGLARKARKKLIDEYSKSILVPGTIFNLAENHERMAEFDQAAGLYEKYAKTYKDMKGLGKAEVSPTKRSKKGKKNQKVKKKDKKEKRFMANRRTWNSEDAQAALLNAGIYREALRQHPKAIQDRLEFVKLFPWSSDAPKVYYSLGLLYEKLKQHAKAAGVFKKYGVDYLSSDLDRAIASHMKVAEMYLKLKKWNDAAKEMTNTIKLYKKFKKKQKKAKFLFAAEAAAHADFLLAESVYTDYIKYRFTTVKPKKMEKHIKKQLAEKTKKLTKVIKRYEKIAIQKQPEWTIASLYKLGRAYENFAETFYNAPVPKGLTPEQVDIYKEMLRSKGLPWEDKAVAHFKAAVEKGSELGFYSVYTRKALEKLQVYRPSEYPKEDLGFRLSVMAESATRSPLLLASWDEAKKDEDMLKQAPLPRQRQAEDSKAAPKDSRPAPRVEPQNKPASGSDQVKTEDQTEEEIPNPASDVLKEVDDESGEPDDEFD
jgi:tetratricopeptide (TPR) repeat protein